jgi:predicted ABC-type transport system involved in lysophospholipase L1 biosynthesis ATPase subunit
LILSPSLLCDEPTGNLDQTTAASVADLLLNSTRPQNILIIVTHNAERGSRVSRRCRIQGAEFVQEP